MIHGCTPNEVPSTIEAVAELRERRIGLVSGKRKVTCARSMQ
jgi:hypothetical protein